MAVLQTEQGVIAAGVHCHSPHHCENGWNANLGAPREELNNVPAGTAPGPPSGCWVTAKLPLLCCTQRVACLCVWDCGGLLGTYLEGSTSSTGCPPRAAGPGGVVALQGICPTLGLTLKKAHGASSSQTHLPFLSPKRGHRQPSHQHGTTLGPIPWQAGPGHGADRERS